MVGDCGLFGDCGGGVEGSVCGSGSGLRPMPTSQNRDMGHPTYGPVGLSVTEGNRAEGSGIADFSEIVVAG
jgi:hypothetical protein